MKKISLILAISTLLYGISATYVLADEEIWDDEGSPPDLGMAIPLGLEPFPVLPTNVKVKSSDSLSLQQHGMCEKSYQVTGDVMAEFPVEVTYVKAGIEYTEEVQWQVNGDAVKSGKASGTGWSLDQTGDTWDVDNPWILTTDDGTAVKKIVLKPIDRQDSDNMKYVFDIGSPQGVTPDQEHTPDTSRGRPISKKTPPNVNFTATYSKPVYTQGHAVKFSGATDGNNVHDDGDTPTHDLYGVLTIEFPDGVESAELPAFRFLADTDCIILIPSSAVNEAIVSSSAGEVNLTLLGEGVVYIKETNLANGESSFMKTSFEVMAGGREEFPITDLVAELKLHHCYSLVAVNDDGELEEENLPLEINGVDMPNNEYCHQ